MKPCPKCGGELTGTGRWCRACKNAQVKAYRCHAGGRGGVPALSGECAGAARVGAIGEESVSRMTDRERCLAEIARCEGVACPGAALGWLDWQAELLEIEREMKLKAPFPWFGGKSRVADIVWDRFGDVPNYVEPFAGSLAVLLGRPHAPRVETVNDLDCYLTNFWRAVKWDPSATAAWADWPVSEADLLARHRWLVDQPEFMELLRADPAYYDCRIAGWWVWGLCAWIGSGWCVQRRDGNQPAQLPHLGDAGMGINRKLPHLGDAGRGEQILAYFEVLSARLRDVRFAQGSWERVLGDSVTVKHGVTGVFLDPPYSADEHDVKYSADTDVAHEVREWAIANGDNPLLRIALCGYEGEHAMPSHWECLAWKARGGYGSQSDKRGRANAGRERIWFSPHCIQPPRLFS